MTRNKKHTPKKQNQNEQPSSSSNTSSSSTASSSSSSSNTPSRFANTFRMEGDANMPPGSRAGAAYIKPSLRNVEITQQQFREANAIFERLKHLIDYEVKENIVKIVYFQLLANEEEIENFDNWIPLLNQYHDEEGRAERYQ